MVCKVTGLGVRAEVVLVSHNPTLAVFTTTDDHLKKIPVKSEGHYDRKDMEALVTAGHAVVYDQKAVRAIMEAAEVLLFGCKPTNP